MSSNIVSKSPIGPSQGRDHVDLSHVDGKDQLATRLLDRFGEKEYPILCAGIRKAVAEYLPMWTELESRHEPLNGRA